MLSLIIPCRNELGNIDQIFEDIKHIRNVSQIIFVEGGSTDGTFQALCNKIEFLNDSRILLLQQTKIGKFNAVLEGSRLSSNQHLVIWDADLTIDFLDLNNLIELYTYGEPGNQEKFVTANRLNPQMQDSAMQPLNRLGNKFFAFAIRYVTGVNVPDALAGSKIFPKHLLSESVNCNRALTLDPFGDLFLLSQIKRHKLKFLSVNCEYRARSYGKSNIRRWSGGLAMLRFLFHILIHRCNRFTQSPLD